MESKFREFVEQDNARSKEIEKQLVAFVKEHNNFIDMRNIKEDKDSCYGVIFNYDNDKYQECRILALTTFENESCLGILVADDIDMAHEYDDMSQEEMLECDAWYTPFGGDLWINATLISVCDVVEEYA